MLIKSRHGSLNSNSVSIETETRSRLSTFWNCLDFPDIEYLYHSVIIDGLHVNPSQDWQDWLMLLTVGPRLLIQTREWSWYRVLTLSKLVDTLVYTLSSPVKLCQTLSSPVKPCQALSSPAKTVRTVKNWLILAIFCSRLLVKITEWSHTRVLTVTRPPCLI